MRKNVLVAVIAAPVLAVLIIIGLSLQGPGDPIDLFEPTDPPAGWDDKSAKVIGNRPIEALNFVKLNNDTAKQNLYQPDPPFDVVLKLGEDAVYEVTIESVTQIGDDIGEDIRSLSGHVKSGVYGRVSLVLTESTARGLVHVDTRVFELIPVSDDVSAIIELRQADFLRESEPRAAHKQVEFSTFDHPVPQPVAEIESERPGPVPVDGSMTMDTAIAPPTIGVLVVQPQADFDCTDSDLTINAGVYQQNLDGALDGIAKSEVTFKCISVNPNWANLEAARLYIRDHADIAAWRGQYGADLVVLLVSDGMGSCGWSMYPDYPDYPINETWAEYYASYGAFSVVDEACALGNYSFAHEIGHLLGMKHERFSESGGVSNTCGYGYPVMRRNAPVGRTILAYPGYCSYRGVDTAAGDCPRIGVYSYPLVIERGLLGWIRGLIHRCFGRIYGQPCSAPGIHHLESAAHNGQRLEDVAKIVATYSNGFTAVTPTAPNNPGH